MKSQKYKEHLQLTPKKTLTRPENSITLNHEYANFGYSLASSDLNNDGIDDIVIGAPILSQDTKASYQTGAVYVILSKDQKNRFKNKELNAASDSNIVINPPENIFNARFGHSIVVLDLNQDGFQDIVISAPSYDLMNLNYQVSV